MGVKKMNNKPDYRLIRIDERRETLWQPYIANWAIIDRNTTEINTDAGTLRHKDGTPFMRYRLVASGLKYLDAWNLRADLNRLFGRY